MLYKVVAALIASSLIAGCDSATHLFHARETLAKQEDRLKAIEQNLETATAELATLRQKQTTTELGNMLRDFEKVAYLQPGDGGYSPVRFDLGTLTVQLADVKPFANSSKISLKFGNPLASSINGLKAKIEWGQVGENGSPNNETAKSKEASFTETLRSGAWTSVSVVLDGTSPTELGFVRVRDVAHTGISLNK